jgi:superfamily II DNA or RNA helicase
MVRLFARNVIYRKEQNIMDKSKLRPWQQEAIVKSMKWFEGNKRFLINAAPGAGKTICASAIAKILIDSNKIDRVIVIAPRREVVKQWAEVFKNITTRSMIKITGSSDQIEDMGLDLCATWSSVQNLSDAFHAICSKFKTLVICDEHHHAAVEAVWGDSALGAFKETSYSIILTGTPIRSDGKETTWFGFDSEGVINHPAEGTYNLTYGEAVELNYCRPITFHKHQGKFTVKIDSEEIIQISDNDFETNSKLKNLQGLSKALDYYKLACTPKYNDKNNQPDLEGYQASMLKIGIEKLDQLQDSIPNTGGLVIAPNIQVAEYMTKLLYALTGDKPILVHSGLPNAEDLISAYKNSSKDWIVSVNMINEGVDIKRLRVLIYLPNAQTELSFRQAMGRVVRTLGAEDLTRAYVIMPTHKIFEEYAKRVELEMKPQYRKDTFKVDYKTCAICEEKNERSAKYCSHCDNEFPEKKIKFKECPECLELNPISLTSCQHCAYKFKDQFIFSLEDALGKRDGVIAHGMDISEEDVKYSLKIASQFKQDVYNSGNAYLIKMLSKVPDEATSILAKLSSKYGDK